MILAIETSTKMCSLAIADRGHIVSEWHVDSGRTHSTGIMLQLEALLERSNIDKKSLTAVAVSIGPGSFTGLRIALSLAKALAIALAIPLIGVPTPLVLARGCIDTDKYIATILDAQRNNFYYTLFFYNGNAWQELSPTTILTYTAIIDQVQAMDKPVMLAGDFKGELFAGAANAQILPEILRLPRAANLAILATQRLSDGQIDCPYTLKLNYLKPSEAEIVWEQKHA